MSKSNTIDIQVNYPPLSRVYDFSKYRILVFENASLQISDCLRILWCGFIAFCESQTRVYDCQARQEPFLQINKCLRFLKPVFSRLRRAQNSQTGVYDFSVKSAQNFRACGGLRIRRHVSTIFVDTFFGPFWNLQTTVYDFFSPRDPFYNFWSVYEFYLIDFLNLRNRRHLSTNFGFHRSAFYNFSENH